MYLRVSKHLDVPAHSRRLINASAFPSVFKLYIVLVWVFCLICQCFLVLIYQTNMTVEKYLTINRQKKEKKPHKKQNLRTSSPELAPANKNG